MFDYKSFISLSDVINTHFIVHVIIQIINVCFNQIKNTRIYHYICFLNHLNVMDDFSR